MVQVGDKVTYIGMWRNQFPMSGEVEKVNGNVARIKLDKPILCAEIHIKDLKKQEGNQE